MPKIKCPGCTLELDENDGEGQVKHMRAFHPEIIAAREAEDALWDGWEDE